MPRNALDGEGNPYAFHCNDGHRMFNKNTETPVINKIDPNRIYRSDVDGGYVVADLGVIVTLRAWNAPWSEAAGRDIRSTLEEIGDR
jgi:hypothetical protein